MPQLKNVAMKKWFARLGGNTPTFSFDDGMLVGDVVLDMDVTPYNIWKCINNIKGQTVWLRERGYYEDLIIKPDTAGFHTHNNKPALDKLGIFLGEPTWDNQPWLYNGDMNKSDYDTNDDGIVNAADFAENANTAAVAAVADEVAWNDVTSKPTFAPVATSNDYDDLDNKPYPDFPITPMYKEGVFNITGDIIELDVYTDSSKITKLFHKVFTYAGDLVTELLITRIADGKKILKTFTYDIDDNWVSTNTEYV